jgi:alpha-beta hydrolase superfamily lysophospholipase
MLIVHNLYQGINNNLVYAIKQFLPVGVEAGQVKWYDETIQGEAMEELTYHSTFDGHTIKALYYPLDRPKARVVLIHGMAEHQRRYAELAIALNRAGYEALTIDQRGHGLSLFDGTVKGFFAETDGWHRNVEDIHAVITDLNAKKPLKLAMFGHSMGTLVARSYLRRHGETLSALYLSGSPDEGSNAAVGAILAKIIATLFGKRYPSMLMHKLAFDAYSASVAQSETDLDWISKDSANVQAYIADPLCGFRFTAQGYIDLAEGLREVYHEDEWPVHNPNLPIRFESGTEDPCHRPNGLERSVKRLKDVGYTNVSFAYIPECRHEIFNDIRKKELTKLLVAWLNHSMK